MTTVLVVVVAVVLLAVAGGGLVLLGRPVERLSSTFTGVRALEVRLAAGRVEVAEDDRTDVRVDLAVRRGPGRPRPDAGVDANGLLVLDGHRSEARLQLRLPRSTRASIEVRAGEITLWGPSGDLRLVTETGTIAGRELSGQAVVARSSGGDVTLHFAASPRHVTALSGTGNVRVVLPGGPYAVDVTSADVSGTEVSVDADPSAERSVTAHSRTGAVRVLAASERGPLRI